MRIVKAHEYYLQKFHDVSYVECLELLQRNFTPFKKNSKNILKIIFKPTHASCNREHNLGTHSYYGIDQMAGFALFITVCFCDISCYSKITEKKIKTQSNLNFWINVILIVTPKRR